MDFEFSDEQRAIRDTARELLAERRAGEGLWPELVELGWAGIGIAEENGGQGLGLVELAILAEQLGHACAETPFLGTALAALAIEAGGDAAQRERCLPALAAGERGGALTLAGRRELIPDAAAGEILVVADADGGTGELYLEAPIEPTEAIDPRRRHGLLRPDAAAGDPLPGGVAAALDRARVVVAAEILGLCRRALEETVAYVKERRQFGVPVGSFQAVKHAAAQMLRDTEMAAVATYYAAWSADFDAPSLPAAAAIAKAAAADAGRAVTAAAIQLHGGIGFTWEADVHWLFKRAQVDAAYLGGAASQRARLARLTTA